MNTSNGENYQYGSKDIASAAIKIALTPDRTSEKNYSLNLLKWVLVLLL